MSMLVRKGTMLHRHPSRRSAGRRSSRESLRKQRNREMTESGGVDGTRHGDVSAGSARRSLGNESSCSWRLSGSHSHQRKESTVSAHLTPNPFFETHCLSPNGNQRNHGEFFGSPRNSGTSQISGEERRELYRYTKFFYDSHHGSSIMRRLKEAKADSRSACDYSKRFVNVFFKSGFGTGFLLIFAILPLSMALVGMKNLESCPLEPHLPLYFLVSGIFGLLRIIWILYAQRKSRKCAEFDLSFFEEEIVPGQWGLVLVKWGLNFFLAVLFVLGNVWTLRLRDPSGQGPPLHAPTLHHPQGWCSRVLVLFSLTHLYVVYILIGVLGLACTLPSLYFAIESHCRSRGKAEVMHEGLQTLSAGPVQRRPSYYV